MLPEYVVHLTAVMSSLLRLESRYSLLQDKLDGDTHEGWSIVCFFSSPQGTLQVKNMLARREEKRTVTTFKEVMQCVLEAGAGKKSSSLKD